MGTPHALPQGVCSLQTLLLRFWPGSACWSMELDQCQQAEVSLFTVHHSPQVGAAAVGGGALFAVTGGLAAPAIAAGMGR